MSDNNQRAIEGSKKYSRAEIARINGVVAKPTSSPQQPPIRTATARPIKQPDPPPKITQGQKPGSGSTTAPKGRPTPKQVKPSKPTPGQTKHNPFMWAAVIVAIIATAVLGGIGLSKLGVGPAVSIADGRGGTIDGNRVGDVGGARSAPAVTGTCEFLAYDATPGSNEFGAKPDPMPTNGSEAANIQADSMARDCKYAATQYVLDVLNEPLTTQNYARVSKLIWDNTEQFRRDKNAWQDAVNKYYAQADQFILVAAPNEKYWSFGFIPGANRSVQPELTQLGEEQDLSLALVVLKKDGTVLDKYRVPCRIQNIMEIELPHPVAKTPPPSSPPPGTWTSTPPPPPNPPVICDHCGPPPPPVCTCDNPCGDNPPYEVCHPPVVCTCDNPCGPPPPECQPPCQATGECKTNHVPSDPGMPLAPQDRFEPTPQVPAQPYTPDIKPGAPSDPNPASPGGVHALPPGQSGSSKPVQEQKPDVNRPVDNPAANAPVTGATTGGTVGGAGSPDPEG